MHPQPQPVPPPPVPLPAHLYPRVQAAIRIANDAVVADVQTSCPPQRSACGRYTWYDVRPMLDEREHSPPVLDMAREALDYGLGTGVLVRHDEQPHLVRVARTGR